MSENSASSPQEVARTTLSRSDWFATIAGLSANFVSIGLARFGYTPLIPALIDANWFSSATTVALGAANLAGYLIGAFAGKGMGTMLSNRLALRASMILATAAFFGCAYPLSVSWFFAWRFLSGFAGGAIMVLVATTVLPHIPVLRRGFAGGMIFLGIGLGIASSGTLIPALLQFGVREPWIGLGILSIILTAISWFGWPAFTPPSTTEVATGAEKAKERIALRVLYAQYALNALGIVPAMILLVDYVARGLGRGAEIGSVYWVAYGLAATAGPIVCGYLADEIGFRQAYRVVLALQAIAAAFLAFSEHWLVIGVTAVILGAFTPGIVPIVFGRVCEIFPHNYAAQRTAWGRTAMAYALFQALGAYGYAFLFSHTDENYSLIFLCGAVALVMALLADFALNVLMKRFR
ncbi:YbfB/YjiJ family MFS transporter [Filomicrobium sp.]|uniref:YbfB/YjiJ family MFS transporter n=1 Tax=Filomicrobium sp. TaxID=2024831 RepID=UPI0025890CF1|nr:YbfB/YjiJ family MFS transporter [Filomicrobium sp.]MCV0368844.1 MFS transporter [Filomicrobium sp.]